MPPCSRLLKLAQPEVIHEAVVSAGGELDGFCWSLRGEQGCPGRGRLGWHWPHYWATEWRAQSTAVWGSIPLPALGPCCGAPPDPGREQQALWVQMLLPSFEPHAEVCFQSTDKAKAGQTTGLTGHRHPGDKRSQAFSWRSVNNGALKGKIKGEKLQPLGWGETLGELDEALKLQSLVEPAH